MAEQWFYAVGTDRKGPVPPAEIASLLRLGTVSAETLVWAPPMAGWEPLGRTPLAQFLQARPAPMPVPAPLPAAAPSFAGAGAPFGTAPSPFAPQPASFLPQPAPAYAAAYAAGPPEVGPAVGEGAVRYRIDGTLMQTVTVELGPGEQLYSQTSAMAWMSDGIRMDTHTGGGLLAGLARSFGGGSFFITDFTADRPGAIAFAPRFPGTILPFALAPGQSLICRKETFLFAQKTVTLEIAWQRRFGAGLFGGEGFILQKVTGPGTVWLDLSGEVVEKTLAPGERLLVSAGHVGIQDPGVQFDIQMVRGFKNILFGGEGLFLATLTGPGRVWLQSMPIMNLAEEIGRFLPGHGASSTATTASAGGLLGGLFGSSGSDGDSSSSSDGGGSSDSGSSSSD